MTYALVQGGLEAVNLDWLTDLAVKRNVARGSDEDSWRVAGYYPRSAIERDQELEVTLADGFPTEQAAAEHLRNLVLRSLTP